MHAVGRLPLCTTICRLLSLDLYCTLAFCAVNPQVFDYPAAGSATLSLHNVGLTCANAAIDEPCVANEPSYPALFDCMWSGEAGGPMARTGPVVANITEHTSPSGVLLGVQPYVRCPLPSYEELVRISGYAGNVDATAVSVNVTLSHYGPVQIPFRGIPGGNLVTVRGLPTPPVSPPSAPPPPPPFSPAVGLRGACSAIRTQAPTSMPA